MYAPLRQVYEQAKPMDTLQEDGVGTQQYQQIKPENCISMAPDTG